MSISKLNPFAVVVSCVLLLCSCGGSQNSAGHIQPNRPAPAPSAAALLPEPSELAAAQPLRAASAFPLVHEGNEMDVSIPPRNVNTPGGSADFSPAYDPGDPLGDCAWALYSFDTSAYSGELSFSLSWLSPPAAGQAWLGVANFSSLRWEWYGIDPLLPKLSLGDFSADFRNGAGASLALVLLTGSQSASLQRIRLGANLPPTPLFSELQNTSLVQGNLFTAMADGSFDSDGFISLVEFDFGDGGGFESNDTNMQRTHIYNNPGDYTVQLRLTDNDAGTATAELAIKVYPPGSEPAVSIQLAPQRPRIGAPVTIDASGSMDSDGSIVKYEFDPEGDGGFIDNGNNPVFENAYADAGIYGIQVRATDDSGLVGEGYAQIGVGWLRSFQGLGNYADVYCTLPDVQGNVFVCGVARLEEGNSDNLEGAFVLKLNANGEVQWMKQFEQTYDQGLTDLAFDPNGKLWAAGYDGKINAGTNPLLLQIDPETGDLLIQKEISQDCDANFPARLAVDSQGRINLGFNADFAGVRTIAVLQFLNSGALNWLRKYDTESSGYDRIFGDVCVDAADRVYLSGRDAVDSMGADSDGAVICLDGNGTLQWAKRLGDNNKLEEFTGICASGPYIYACGVYSDASQQCLLAQFNAGDGSLGNLISYSNSASGNMAFYSCCPDTDSGCFVSGHVDDLMNESDASVLHFDSLGNIVSRLAFGEGGTEEGNYLCKIHQGLDGAVFWGGEAPSHNTGFASLMGNAGTIVKPLADLGDVLVEPAWTISDQTYGYANLSLTEDNGGGFVMCLYP